jgi:hypothetical protein
MTARDWSEAWLAMVGALRLACGDRRGLAYFDASAEGFWRSFRAAVLGYPLYLALLAMRITGAQWTASGAATILVVETISYVISWVAFPLLILPVARGFGRADRFFSFMVAYNWSQVPQSVLLVLIGLQRAAGLSSPSAAQSVELIATVALLVYEWYIARTALATTGIQSMLVVILDLVLGSVLGRITEALY